MNYATKPLSGRGHNSIYHDNNKLMHHQYNDVKTIVLEIIENSG